MEFKRGIEKVKKANRILVVSHYDCDGLCSAKILMESLKRCGKLVKVKIIKEITEKSISEIEKEDVDLIIFSDLGSGYLSMLPKNREIVILDHHTPEDTEVPKNIVQVNPILENKELCGAGVCYLFAKELDDKNIDLIDFAVIGAIGDNQIEIGENKKIREEAIRNNRLKVEKGLKIFGQVNKPLHESLKNSNILPLNNDSHVVQFLNDLGIDLNGGQRSYCDLTDEERKKLILGIIKERLLENMENPADIFSNIYVLTKQKKILSDALEFSTILNAFGRLEKYDEVFELLSGNISSLDAVLREYKRKIADYLSWTTKNINNFKKEGDILFINAEKNIDANMIGTITSILINSFTDKKIIVGLAEDGDFVKISARSRDQKANLDHILRESCKKLGGSGGGHKEAAGGKIKKGKEEEFMETFYQCLYNNF